MISQTSTKSPIQVVIDSTPDPLNWGSETSFQTNSNYTIAAHHPSKKDTIDRLLENTKWLILHYEDVTGKLPTTYRHVI
jgi:hypothetical protein